MFVNTNIGALFHLRKKSRQNKTAADFLIDNGLYASSIHCSYFGVLQFMTCMYCDLLNKSLDDITKETKGKEGSHNYIIIGLFSYITSTYRNNQELGHLEKNLKDIEVQQIRRKVKDLKNYRVRSDYQNVSINKEAGEKAYRWSLKIREGINELLQ